MTVNELLQAAFDRMQYLTAGSAPSAADKALLRNRYRSLHALLRYENLVDWSEDDDVPPYCEQAIVAMLAAHGAVDFQKRGDLLGVLKLEGQFGARPPSQAEMSLRRVMQRPSLNQSVCPEYY